MNYVSLQGAGTASSWVPGPTSRACSNEAGTKFPELYNFLVDTGSTAAHDVRNGWEPTWQTVPGKEEVVQGPG